MKTRFARVVCGLLAFSLAVLPMQASASLIGTDQAVTAAQASAARTRLQATIARTEVAAQLQSLGISPQAAQQRVAALTDAEAASLAGQIDWLPAGAGGQAIGFLIVAIFLIWRFFYSDQAKAEAAPAKPAAKPAAKPDAKK
jgi:hypothetical protein